MSEPLLTLVHDPGVDALLGTGRVLERNAVKAVALRGRDLLVLRADSGAVKLPGGGAEPGESVADTLRRELAEECAVPLLEVGEELVSTVQLARPQEPDYDVFRMTSRHFLCAVGEPEGEPRLEDYEQRLGLEPAWLDVTEAADACAAALRSGDAVHRWLERELAVLRLVEERLG